MAFMKFFCFFEKFERMKFHFVIFWVLFRPREKARICGEFLERYQLGVESCAALRESDGAWLNLSAFVSLQCMKREIWSPWIPMAQAIPTWSSSWFPIRTERPSRRLKLSKSISTRRSRRNSSCKLITRTKTRFRHFENEKTCKRCNFENFSQFPMILQNNWFTIFYSGAHPYDRSIVWLIDCADHWMIHCFFD